MARITVILSVLTIMAFAPVAAQAATLGVSADAGLTAGAVAGNTAAATELQLTWARVDVSWPTVAPNRPRSVRNPNSRGYSWTSVDRQFQAALTLGIDVQILLSVRGTPNWARADGGVGGSPTDPTWMPKRVLWQNFIASLMRRYSGKVAALEVWPEPNLLSSLRPQRLAGHLVAPGFLRVLTKLATVEVRAVSATLPIITGGLARTDPASPTDTPARTFLRAMKRARVPGDAIGLRLVPPTGIEGTTDPANLSVTDSAGLVAAIDGYWPNQRKRIWLTGYDAPSGPISRGVSADTQAFAITRFLNAAADSRVDVAIWNTLADTPGAPYGGILPTPTRDPFAVPVEGTNLAWDAWTAIVAAQPPPG